LPQIFNAIKGEMSLVGSRTYLDRKMGDEVNTIILAKSGILATGVFGWIWYCY
jgi:hypothetical protein